MLPHSPSPLVIYIYKPSYLRKDVVFPENLSLSLYISPKCLIQNETTDIQTNTKNDLRVLSPKGNKKCTYERPQVPPFVIRYQL